MDKHLKNIKTLIDKNIVYERKVNILKERNKVNTYFNIGKEIVEAMGKKKPIYGTKLLKEYAFELTKEYGKGYDYSNLRKIRQFYLIFEKCATVWHKLSWSQIRLLLPIKEEGKRNYYINLTIKNTLSVRELKEEIKNNSYERLTRKDYNKTIGVIICKKNDVELTKYNKNNNILVTSYKIR